MPDRVGPLIQEVLKTLKEDHRITRRSAVGYRFGAKYVIRGLAEGPGVDVGYIAHPSFVEAKELKAIKGPLSIAAAGKPLFSIPCYFHLPCLLCMEGSVTDTYAMLIELDYVFHVENHRESEDILK